MNTSDIVSLGPSVWHLSRSLNAITEASFNSGDIQFDLTSSSNKWTSFKDSYFAFRLQVCQKNGAGASVGNLGNTNGTLVGRDEVCLSRDPLACIFSNLRVLVGDKEIMNVSNPAVVDCASKVCFESKATLESSLSGMFINLPPNNAEGTKDLDYVAKQRGLFSQYRDLWIPLYWSGGIFEEEKFPSNCKVSIILTVDSNWKNRILCNVPDAMVIDTYTAVKDLADADAKVAVGISVQDAVFHRKVYYTVNPSRPLSLKLVNYWCRIQPVKPGGTDTFNLGVPRSTQKMIIGFSYTQTGTKNYSPTDFSTNILTKPMPKQLKSFRMSFGGTTYPTNNYQLTHDALGATNDLVRMFQDFTHESGSNVDRCGSVYDLSTYVYSPLMVFNISRPETDQSDNAEFEIQTVDNDVNGVSMFLVCVTNKVMTMDYNSDGILGDIAIDDIV